MHSFARKIAKKILRTAVTKQSERRRKLQVETLEHRLTPTGIYSGVVFQDFNSNGTRDLTTTIANVGVGTIPVAVDRGIEGITVSAFNTAGGSEGSTATLANGSFSFTPTGAGPYRFEFSSLPPAFFPGPDGPNSRSTVQFAPDGGAATLSLGIVRPTDYSENNPLLITNQYVFGDQATQTPNETVLLSFPYAAGGGTSNPGYALPGAPHEIQIPANQIGTTWGLGWDQFGRDIYAAAYFKRHAGFGPDGTGAIYQIPVPATLPPAPYAPPGPLLYADLNAIFGAGTAGPNQHDTVDGNGNGLQDDYDTDNGNTGWNAVGKTSLGGLDVSDDGQFIFAMNLFDRQLYRIPTSGVLDNTTIQRVSIPLTNPDAAIIAPGTFNSDDLRPFAVEYHNGQLYVGVVYNAETTDDRNELLALVYRVDPVTLTFSATPIFQARLNYVRSQSSVGFAPAPDGTLPSTWEPWESAYFSTAAAAALGVAPQPMLSGLTFDPDGNMVLGIRDRGADQNGYFQLSNPGSGTRIEGFTAGDILRAFINTPNDLNSGWTLESNARGPGGQGTGPQGNNRGPGGAEYYFEDSYGSSHGETAMGGILQLAGFPDVALTNMDPGADFRAGGISWFRNQTGAETKAYEIYQNVNNPLPFEATFSKANGLGDLIALTSQAPLEIGDRVWLDRNGNGVQDAGEEGIENVVIDLLDNVGGVIDSATTDSNGNYYFSSASGTTTGSRRFGLPQLQPGQDFSLRILNAAGGAQQAEIVGRRLTTADVASGVGSDIRDSDGTLIVNDAIFDFTTGIPGSNDHTFDFGFQFTFDLGNRVWNDTDNSGTINGAEVGIDGVTVNLFVDANNDGTADGPIFRTTNTAGGGYYRFDDLPANTYIVEVDTNSAPLAGLVSSFVNGGDPDAVTVDSDDNGVVLGIGFIRSNPVTLGPDDLEPTNETDLGPGDPAEPNGETNLTVDFGFVSLYSVGNRVWNDADNSGTINGVEVGINGVTVNLYRDSNNDGVADGVAIGTDVTAGGGYYRFDDLIADTYILEVVTTSAPLVGLVSSSLNAGDPDVDLDDSDDNGVVAGVGFIRANPVTLGPLASEPTTETDLGPGDAAEPNGRTNLTVDFGFVSLYSVGNRVWNDADNSGTINGAEVGIDGVTVNLYRDSNNDGVADGVAIGTDVTAGGGYYRFDNLIADTYIVEVDTTSAALLGLVSSSLNAGDPDVDLDDSDDNGVVAGVNFIRSNPVTLGPGASEPIAEADLGPGDAIEPDGRTNQTVDFGFASLYSLGNRVWNDSNDSGTIDGVEVGIDGVTVNLYRDSNNDGVADGAAIGTTVTAGGGYYRFSSLIADTYIVEVDTTSAPLAGLVSSAINAGDPDVDLDDSDDNGSVVGVGFVRSEPVTLGPGVSEPITEADLGPGDPTEPDGRTNLTVDFGFVSLYSLGNRVWNDADNSGTINGLEVGIDGVTVNIYRDSNNDGVADGVAIGTDVTAGGGYYRFDDLIADTYILEVVTTSAPLVGLVSSSLNAGDPDVDLDDSDDNGVVAGIGFIRSNPVTLGPGAIEPTTEADLGPGDTAEPNGLTNLTVDFGFNSLFSLGNRVWNDADNSGTINGAEVGIDGVTVNLYRDSNDDGVADGAAIGTVVTAAGGYYRFDLLIADTYIVEVDTTSVALAGLLSSTVNAGDPDVDLDDSDDNGVVAGVGFIRSNPVTLGPGASEPTTEADLGPSDAAEPNARTNQTVDFGFFGAASEGNFVWEDLNGNGIQDLGEPGIDGVTVNLLGAGDDNTFGTPDDITDTTITAGGGLYSFPSLAPGSYRLTFVEPGGYTITAPNRGANDAVDSDADPITGETAVNILTIGEIDDTWDTGMYRPVTIGDFVWEDQNGNGIQDGEPGVSGVTINLLGAGPDGMFGTADDFNDSGVTDGIGGYLFTGLAPGLYQVTFVAPVGFSITAQNQGADDTLDSDANPANGQTATFAVPSNTSNVDWDAGIFQPASVGDRLWYDADGDGVQDAGEPGINGATVILDYAGPDGLFGTPDDQIGLATEPTVIDGNYLFDNLAPGNYRVRVDSATLPNGLTDPTFDLDLIATPNVASFSVGSNEDRTDVDFGYRGTASLGDRVWYDADGDTVQDAVETGLNGVNVQLTWAGQDGIFGTADDFVSTRLTAGDGNYLFDDLPSGNFRVNVLNGVPPAYNPTFDLDGILTPNVATTTLTIGQARTDADFGYADRSSISGFVYLDLDNDGVRDPGENAISQVDIILTGTDLNNNPVNLATTTSVTGFYSFPNLLAGTYSIQEIQPKVVLDGKDTPGTPALGGTQTNDRFTNLVLPAGTNGVDFNFGELPLTTSIRGNVYLDKDNDGARDPGEPGIGGVTVWLRGVNDLGQNVNKAVVTDSQGRYAFLQMRPGLYRVAEVHPTGFVDGKDTPGSLLGMGFNDVIREITVPPGAQGVEYNFGERKAAVTVVLSKRLYISTPSATGSISALTPGSGKKIVEKPGLGDGQIEP